MNMHEMHAREMHVLLFNSLEEIVYNCVYSNSNKRNISLSCLHRRITTRDMN